MYRHCIILCNAARCTQLAVGWVFKIEDDWLPLAVDCFYYAVLTGQGQRTLGESYSHLMPVDLESRGLLLKNKIKRMVWVLATVILPFLLRKNANRDMRALVDILEPLNRILLYATGKYSTIINRTLSIRYVNIENAGISVHFLVCFLDFLSEETALSRRRRPRLQRTSCSTGNHYCK